MDAPGSTKHQNLLLAGPLLGNSCNGHQLLQVQTTVAVFVFPTLNTYDRLSWDRDFSSACWYIMVFFIMLALKSSNPLNQETRPSFNWKYALCTSCHYIRACLHMSLLVNMSKWYMWPSVILQTSLLLPGGLFGRSLQLSHHMQEVETEKDSSLK